jgi:signal transduction histidine kinase
VKNKSRSEIEFSLRERIKELECLNSISQILFEMQDDKLEAICKEILKVLPKAWQYPELTSSRIQIDGINYKSEGFVETPYSQKENIVLNGLNKGFIEVAYSQKTPDFDEGPFLKEERTLLNTIAKELSLMIDKINQKNDKYILELRLRHADRLVTIGEFSAGIAHELNEPLGTILGFAQLAKKSNHVSTQLEKDLSKIVDASLYARDILRKLMTFARNNEQEEKLINFNSVIKNSIYLLETRSKNSNIRFVKILEEKLPSIWANAVQLNQVIINLCVNSIQAMPEGGNIVLQTRSDKENVYLTIQDSGIGISKDTIKRIFDPFFTTKKSSTNTGLGLSVTHGIISLLNGKIKVESNLGVGTRFEIIIPLKKEKKDS